MARTTRSAPSARARPGGASSRTRAPRRRNPNRWRFYVLLVLLGLIVTAVLWFAVGRDVWGSFLEARADSDQVEPDDDQSPEGERADGGADEPDDPAEPLDDPEARQDPASGAADGAAGTPAQPDEEDLANPVECRAEALRVEVDPGGRMHNPGREVSITVQVSNTGAVPCLVDLGHESMQVEISSGSDDIWSTAQCPRGQGQRELLLDVDGEVSHVVTWPGQRCGSGEVAAEGTYRIDVAVPATPAAASADAVIELD